MTSKYSNPKTIASLVVVAITLAVADVVALSMLWLS